MNGCVWRLRQRENQLSYQVFELDNTKEDGVNPCKNSSVGETIKVSEQPKSKSEMDFTIQNKYTEILSDYFQFGVNLDALYTDFGENDEHFRKKASDFKGVRLLRQDPVETLFSFICSSNNNITRITGMIERMSQCFGEKITQLDGVDYYRFPSVERLAGDDVEKTLRDLGFGYRAKFIVASAKKVLSKGGAQYLGGLRSADYESAKAALMELPGVGAKVADCVCLMSLDKMAAVPVDTHVKQIAERDYKLRITAKSCTDAVYRQIGDFFRNLWGPYAGWAQCVLFASDLKKFQQSQTTEPESVDAEVTKRQTRKRKRT